MEFGFYLPDNGPLATPDVIGAVAAHAEAAGFEILAVSDHVVMPKGIDSTYPYEEDGQWPGGMDCMETLTLMSFIAARTSRARILSSVLVLPYRAPILTAKMLATIDVLSGGRVIAGLGVGWMAEEFEALQSPPYRERGVVSDEYIDVFKSLWTSDAPAYNGTYCKFSDVVFEPKPVQKPHLPIWIGGESGPALRRTARVADAWYPISTNPRGVQVGQGKPGWYFSVLNCASENGLSSDTWGRLSERVTPRSARSCAVHLLVIGAPRSE